MKDKCPKCKRPKDVFQSQCNDCIDDFAAGKRPANVIYVDDSDRRKRQEAALKWISEGFKYGEPECKTVGYIPERPEGHHCPACWMHRARNLAKNALS